MTSAEEEAVVALHDLCSEIWFSHGDKDSPDYNECELDMCAWCSETKLALGILMLGVLTPAAICARLPVKETSG